MTDSESSLSSKISDNSQSDQPDIEFSVLRSTGNKIRYAYHLSDIHIRNTQRHDEYTKVFDRCYKKLSTEIGDSTDAIIVLTGDIMHSKTELSPEAVYLAYHFFEKLSAIAPVILIPGNHDCNLSNRHRLDALSPIVDDIGKLDNLFYLKKSGTYLYENIIFGVTSIFDSKLVAASAITQQSDYKIALYHGAVHGAVTDVGYRMNNHQLLAESFTGYDFVMLGDIHKYQYMNAAKTIAYAGSLIQQSYGESLKGHGVLKWDLSTGASELLEIRNSYGYCTVRLVDGKMVPTKIPSKPRIRFCLENTTQLAYQDILRELEKQYQICEVVKESSFQSKTSVTAKPTAYAVQKDIMEAYLKDRGLNPILIEQINALHEATYQKILAEKKDQVADFAHNANATVKWKLLELRFSNTLSYGKNNHIDFRSYDVNKIIAIVAPNHYGKSAILDIILFCLFDKFSRGDRRDILNKNQNKMRCSLRLSVGSITYLIERIGVRTKKSVKIDVNFYQITSENGLEVYTSLNGIDKNETNKKIVDLIGDYNDYLTTCFCLQNSSKGNNFIEMTHQQKKEYLNSILRLNVFADCYDLAKAKLKKIAIKLKMHQQAINDKSIAEMKARIQDIHRQIAYLKRNVDYLETTQADIFSLTDEQIQSNPLANLVSYADLSMYRLESIADIRAVQQQIKQIDPIDITEIKSDIDQTQTALDAIPMPDIDSMQKQKYELMGELRSASEPVSTAGLADTRAGLTNRLAVCADTIRTFVPPDLSKIPQLKQSIITLRSELKPVSNTDFDEAVAEWNTHQDQLLAVVPEILRAVPVNPLIITRQEAFMKKIELDLSILQQYQRTDHVGNNELIELLSGQHQDYINRSKRWISRQTSSGTHQFDITALCEKSKTIQQKLVLAGLNVITLEQNKSIQAKIDAIQAELDAAYALERSNQHIQNLINEKALIEEKIRLIDNKFALAAQHDQAVKHNDILRSALREIQSSIDAATSTKTRRLHLQNHIDLQNKLIADHTAQCSQLQHLVLLEEYEMRFLARSQLNNVATTLAASKMDFITDIADMSRQIDKLTIELTAASAELEAYMLQRKKFDDLTVKNNMYQIYAQITNYNGLPYELLKTYLPMIESDVNRVLHSMVNFSIGFRFNEATTDMKSSIGYVDVVIQHQNTCSYSAQLASGFEKFIISLAIRMTLCQISMMSKPNVLIIDEGWSCMDGENLSNVGSIMAYIKSQYEHVVIISHLSDLKNQADYVINIEKLNGYSRVRTHVEKKLIKE